MNLLINFVFKISKIQFLLKYNFRLLIILSFIYDTYRISHLRMQLSVISMLAHERFDIHIYMYFPEIIIDRKKNLLYK